MPPILQALRHGLLSRVTQHGEDDQEDEQNADDSDRSLLASFLGNNAKSDEETATIKLSSVNERDQSLVELLDEEQFMKLDNAIKEGKATEEEEQEFSTLVPQMAKIQVKDYQKTPEEEKQLLEAHKAKFHQHSPEEEKKLRDAHKDKYHSLAAEKEKLTIEEHTAKFNQLTEEE